MRQLIFIFFLTLALASAPLMAGAHGGEKHAKPAAQAPAPESFSSESFDEFETIGEDEDVTYGQKSSGGDSISDLLFEEEDPLDLRDLQGLPDTADVGKQMDHEAHATGDAITKTMPAMESTDEHAGHDMAAMKKVELATHEWVSPSQKGYGLAVTITLVSGLAFAGLMYRRPFE